MTRARQMANAQADWESRFRRDMGRDTRAALANPLFGVLDDMLMPRAREPRRDR
jgi:hypothetical protein